MWKMSTSSVIFVNSGYDSSNTSKSDDDSEVCSPASSTDSGMMMAEVIVFTSHCE